MSTAYSRLLWGLLLIMIDIRIFSFDILPDILGCILLLAGLSLLRRLHRGYATGWWAAIALIFLSIPQTVIPPDSIRLDGGSLSLWQILYAAVSLAVESVVLYGICAGTAGCASVCRLQGLKRTAESRWRFCFWVSSLWLLASPFALNVKPVDMLVVGVVFLPVLFIAQLAIVLLIRRAGRELRLDMRV